MAHRLCTVVWRGLGPAKVHWLAGGWLTIGWAWVWFQCFLDRQNCRKCFKTEKSFFSPGRNNYFIFSKQKLTAFFCHQSLFGAHFSSCNDIKSVYISAAMSQQVQSRDLNPGIIKSKSLKLKGSTDSFDFFFLQLLLGTQL